jgi:hypothetical protein
MLAQELLRLHREEVAIQHGGRLDEVLGQRDRRELEREAARLPDAALHLLDPRPEVVVAGVDVGPGIDDADHRLAGIVLLGIADLLDARAMPERAQVAHAEPAMASQLLRLLAAPHSRPPVRDEPTFATAYTALAAVSRLATALN